MIIKEENKNEKNKPKRKKTLSVPNLDFSEILKHYTKKDGILANGKLNLVK